ncbi:phosphonate C-P lyase system protein PhnH [Aliihoeflea sp. 2WW]|uniref:phosphonate C-P lyase system protein PhnH n=1 Tax=Aliihoeflea sp. 2WW TaxID=1381123 RepID=UPI0004672E58|nr:phosphonate C-P lyase system protein PhnH [Aliihoeflea sp. 2WW]
MNAQMVALEGGFPDPVFDAQATFRAVMNAMAELGTRQPVHATATPPAPLSPTAGALALTLCDQDTCIWLEASLTSEAVIAWLRYQTGATIVDNPAQAQFAFVADASSMPRLDAFAEGSQDYPDRSTTLVLIVDALDSGEPLLLEGPGIERRSSLAPTALPGDFRSQWRDNGVRFPRGVDLVFAARHEIACLPRTTRILEPAEA